MNVDFDSFLTLLDGQKIYIYDRTDNGKTELVGLHSKLKKKFLFII